MAHGVLQLAMPKPAAAVMVLLHAQHNLAPAKSACVPGRHTEHVPPTLPELPAAHAESGGSVTSVSAPHVLHTTAPVALVFPLAHAVGEVAPTADTELPAGLSQHEVAPGKSVNFPAGHAAQLPPILPRLPAGH